MVRDSRSRILDSGCGGNSAGNAEHRRRSKQNRGRETRRINSREVTNNKRRIIGMVIDEQIAQCGLGGKRKSEDSEIRERRASLRQLSPVEVNRQCLAISVQSNFASIRVIRGRLLQQNRRG